MQHLSEELAYVHQAHALCQAMRDRLADSLVCYASEDASHMLNTSGAESRP